MIEEKCTYQLTGAKVYDHPQADQILIKIKTMGENAIAENLTDPLSEVDI